MATRNNAVFVFKNKKEVKGFIRFTRQTIKTNSRKGILAAGKEAARRASLRAPVESGLLETAIQADNVVARDDFYSIRVHINSLAGHRNTPTNEYGMYLEAGMEIGTSERSWPADKESKRDSQYSYHLGESSVIKDHTNEDNLRVGGRFLARTFDEDKLLLENVLRRAIGWRMREKTGKVGRRRR